MVSGDDVTQKKFAVDGAPSVGRAVLFAFSINYNLYLYECPLDVRRTFSLSGSGWIADDTVMVAN